MLDVNSCKNENDYKGLVKSIITLKLHKERMKQNKPTNIDEMAANDLHVNNASRLIENIVTDLAKDIESLLKFSFELLIFD